MNNNKDKRNVHKHQGMSWFVTSTYTLFPRLWLYFTYTIKLYWMKCAISILPNRNQLHQFVCTTRIGFSFSFLCGHLIRLIHHIAIDYQLPRLYIYLCMTMIYITHMLYTWHMQCNYVQRSHIDTHTYEMREGFSFFLTHLV